MSSLVVKKEPDFPFHTGGQSFKTYNPNDILYPQQAGNPDRIFYSLNHHEMTEGLSAVLTERLNFLTLVGDASALTYAWPKIKLAEDIHVLEGSSQQYNITPFSDVPQRGTVRFMSEQKVSYSLAIAQKGIGARIAGRVINSHFGPAELEKQLMAFAESLSVTMSLNTAIGIPQAAFLNALENSGEASFATNYAQKIASDLQVYASMGAHPGRLVGLVEDVLRKHPDFDTVFLPDGAEHHMDANTMVSVKINVPIYAYDDRGYLELESKQTLQSLASIKNGRVAMFEMPVFSLYANNRTLQTLESEVVIGEVYCDDNTQHYGKHERNYFNPQSEDVYLYDQPSDHYRKIRFSEAIRNAYIWNPSSEGGYHPVLVDYVARLNANGKAPSDATESGVPLQYPVGRRKNNRGGVEFYLPFHIGNLSAEHLSDNLLNEMVESGISALTVGAQNRALFADATGDMDTLNRLRETIEDLDYDAASFEKIAAANINRSVFDNGSGFNFAGETTPINRLQADEAGRSIQQTLTEWKPNAHGGLDIPIDAAPVGYFSAAGLRTLSYTRGHDYSPEATAAYNFLQMLVARIRDIFHDSPLNNTDLIMPHLHRDDPIQNVMDAIYGHRLPLFLAAPEALVTGSSTGSLPTVLRLGSGVVATTGNPNDGLVRVSGDLTYFESPSGILFAVDRPQALKPGSTIGIDQFISDNGQLLRQDLVGEITRNLSADQQATFTQNIATLRRLLVAKSVSAKDEQTILNLYQAYNGILIAANDTKNLASFNTDVKVYFINGVPTKKKDLTVWQQGFDALVAKGQSPFAADFLNAVSNYAKENQYQRLSAAARQRVDTSSEAYETFTALASDAIALLDREQQSQKFYYSNTPGFQFEGRSNLRDDLGNLGTAASTTAIQNLDAVIASLGGSEQVYGVKLVRNGTGTGDANAMDLANASYYRAPLNATFRILNGIRNIEYPWVLPADPEQAFNQPVVPGDIARVMRTNFILNTQSNAMAFAGKDEEGSDFYFDYLRATAPFLADEISNQGDMERRMKMVRSEYPDNTVKRLVGISILLAPHTSMKAIENLASSGIVLPCTTVSWRLQSKGLFGDTVVMKHGMDSGVNLWNKANIAAAVDNVRYDTQLRATIYTDAHVIRPENHVLVGPAQPRGYIGGHNTMIVRSREDLSNHAEEYRPSVIVTIVPRGHMETRHYPISFINKVPAMIDRQSGKPVNANPAFQYWSGGDYYGHFVYGTYFVEDGMNMMRFDVTSRNAMIFDAHSLMRNHLAFRGYHARFDPISGYFSREVIGNGHRADPRLNSPGARAYFNMESKQLYNIKLLSDLKLT